MTAGPSKPKAPFRRRRSRSLAGPLGIAVIVAAAGGAGAFKLRPVPVTTMPVVRGVAVEAVYATGTLEAAERLTIRAKVAGAIEQLTVREGDTVTAGDLLARVNSPSVHHDLARGEADRWAATQEATSDAPQIEALRAQVRATEADLANAKDDLQRTTKLFASGATHESEVERARTRVAGHEAQLAAQSARLQSLRIELQAHARASIAAAKSLSARVTDGDVRSPLSGVVLAKYAEPGEVVAQNQPLFFVGTADNLNVECAVDEEDIGRVAPGKVVAISIHALANQTFSGRVKEIFPDADRAKKTFLVKIKLDGPQTSLRSGMSAEINIVIDEHPGALLAPSDSVDAHGGAWVVTNGRAERRTVQVGIRDLLRVEVLGGLREGEQIVTLGSAALSQGARVSPTVIAPNVNEPIPRPKTGGGGTL
jgi:HlyD family secretion protein